MAVLTSMDGPVKSNPVRVAFLFQSLLTTSLPVVNDLVQESQYRDSLANLPEIARLLIQNGVILYALSRATGGGR